MIDGIDTRSFGKLFVLGEYAVVEPAQPSIVVGVNCEISVGLVAATSAGSGVIRDPSYGEQPVQWVLRSTQGEPPIEIELVGRPADHVSSALAVIEELRAHRGIPASGYDLQIASELQDAAGSKLGLGSSGAITVALIDAVQQHYELMLSRDEIMKLSLLATIERSPKASGGDVAASAHGGWLLYSAPDRDELLRSRRANGIAATLDDTRVWDGLRVERLPQHPDLRLLAGWTGAPASTDRLVAALQSGVDDAYLRENRRIVECFAEALRSPETPGSLQSAMRSIREARSLLLALSASGEPEIETAALTTLVDAANAVGAAAKSSGAGGGDCGIVIAPRDQPLEAMFAKWEAAGIRNLNISVASATLASKRNETA